MSRNSMRARTATWNDSTSAYCTTRGVGSRGFEDVVGESLHFGAQVRGLVADLVIRIRMFDRGYSHIGRYALSVHRCHKGAGVHCGQVSVPTTWPRVIRATTRGPGSELLSKTTLESARAIASTTSGHKRS